MITCRIRMIWKYAVQVLLDQLTFGPLNNIANLMFFSILVESALLRSQSIVSLCKLES
jgi:hypothetical protein